ncbi:hypothetical protein D3C84_471930 [compost metagenome]
MKSQTITPVFVEFIPEKVEAGKLYISEQYETAIHACCCGCGEEVVTPLRPDRWRLIKRGNLVSLSPSIGNWEYACQSHYFIRDNQIVWAGKMNRQQIARVQQRDNAATNLYIAQKNAQRDQEAQAASKQPQTPEPSLWGALVAIWALIRSFFRRG